MDYHEHQEELITKIKDLSEELLDIEMKLQEVLDTATKDFTDRVKKIIEDIKKKSGEFVIGVGTEYDEFYNSLKVEAVKQCDELVQKIMDNDGQDDYTDTLDIEGNVLELLGDKDTLNQVLEQSKEAVDNKITEQENVIMKAINEEWRTCEQRILDEQHSRNRQFIKDTIEQCKIFEDKVSK
jgi:ElaB/YqjD/DUF883 family membrane-anchored ribosome-binding protein